jgi:hypothetical protein
VGFGRNGVFRRQMYQHRGSGLDIVSFGFRCTEHRPLARRHIPRNSTQLISISSLSPSADNGISSSRLRNTNGPASGRCFLVIGFSGSCSSIFQAICAQATIFAYLRSYARAYRAVCDGNGGGTRLEEQATISRDEAGILGKLSKHQSNLTPHNFRWLLCSGLTSQLLL